MTQRAVQVCMPDHAAQALKHRRGSRYIGSSIERCSQRSRDGVAADLLAYDAFPTHLVLIKLVLSNTLLCAANI